MTNCLENFLSSGKFLINLSRIPGVDFYCQSIATPDVNVNTTNIKYAVGNIYETDSQISYGDLSITFIVDENLNNYNKVLEWMQQISPDTNFDDTSKLLKESQKEGKGFDYTDIELIFPNSKKSFIYQNCTPQSLSGLEFNVSEDLFITANITFKVPQLKIISKI